VSIGTDGSLAMFDEHHNETVTQSSVPHTEGVSTHSGGPVGRSVAPGHTPVIGENDAPADGFARNRIRFHIACEECGGTGRYTLDGGNNPYARIYECDVCQGTGVWADDEECAA
jgi:hypothetical protein